jgi:hypothetical protein
MWRSSTNELAMNSENKNIRDLYRAINEIGWRDMVDWIGLAKNRAK